MSQNSKKASENKAPKSQKFAITVRVRQASLLERCLLTIREATTMLGSALLALPPESSVDDSHHVHPTWKRPQQKQGFDGVKRARPIIVEGIDWTSSEDPRVG
ncbi:uncharacterized protein PAC_19026 [Phialocephala subalpina]|uniref:Uncharacterized protein n=1 Tax=Phialocephala subalpina TaxID=576137 RepID=A0A1L7XVS2_9HELO|nr:uncharacterized protein PAC_19026 [Phialocephala subalpina]